MAGYLRNHLPTNEDECAVIRCCHLEFPHEPHDVEQDGRRLTDHELGDIPRERLVEAGKNECQREGVVQKVCERARVSYAHTHMS